MSQKSRKSDGPERVATKEKEPEQKKDTEPRTPNLPAAPARTAEPKRAPPRRVPAKTKAALTKEAEGRWDVDITELRDRRINLAGSLLQYRYDIGLLVVRIVDEKQKPPHERCYGLHTMRDVAEQLDESSTTVYDCMKFAKQFDKRQLEDLKAHEWPWRTVQAFLTVEDPAARKQLKADFEKGEYATSSEFKEDAKKATAGKKKGREAAKAAEARGGGTQAVAMVQSFNMVSVQLESRLFPELIEGVKTFVRDAQKMNPKTAEKMAAGIVEAKSHLTTIRLLLTKAEKLVRDSGI